jgi:glycosyltransferase involved in cell wall biosynthesis
MKISIVGPGEMPIPPIGWGAIETLIWDMRNALISLGHEVQIINEQNPEKIIHMINEYRPDFVHVHYDNFITLYPYIQYPKAITSHFGYIERPEMFGGYANIVNYFTKVKPTVFCLSESIKNVYKILMNIEEDNLYINPNGVNSKAFYFNDIPKYSDRSIYLAKIDYRKRQHLFQSIDSLWYAGNIADQRFNVNKNYLGEWSKETLYNELTNYGNLVLLSDGEAHPLVCMEALACGLGIVVSQFGTANLDTTKEFIDVIPEDKINDISYVESIIVKNRKYSVLHRKEILEYSKQFDWQNIITKYYIPNVKKVIEGL